MNNCCSDEDGMDLEENGNKLVKTVSKMKVRSSKRNNQLEFTELTRNRIVSSNVRVSPFKNYKPKNFNKKLMKF